ncbi:unnamed protein product [Paramecium sonneborni]|uniref:Uncharacterized protein n=1 Tax=Paramecium sonneborni TaxID=65129 RepID=A0A8S1R3B6_9CILI|nr:unnamed protein product [Paramecium sonneborni]
MNNQIQPKILIYLEQVKYLNWIQEYGKNQQKNGRWFVKWNGEFMIDVGGYYQIEWKKNGFWKELIENYQKNTQNIWIIGFWQFLQNEQLIGGGLYNQQGFKHGLWSDLSDNYRKNSQVTYIGEYKNGQQVGNWKIKYKNQFMQIKQQIDISGGGYYTRQGLKRGKWIELKDFLCIEIINFLRISQITFVGEYREGLKFGIWEILEENQYIGCGLYDTYGLKNKKWFDLNQNFKDYIQIIYQGEYNDGKRQGYWKTLFRYDRQSNFEQMCKGFSNDKGQKNGKWIVLNNNFNHTCQVIYEGEYKNGLYIHRWDTISRYDEDHGFLYLYSGGCSFDHNGYKYGKWTELQDKFEDQRQVIFNGEQNNLKKSGQWDIMFRYTFRDQFKKVQIFYSENYLKIVEEDYIMIMVQSKEYGLI